MFSKKTASEIAADDKIISEKEYMKISGLSSYEKKLVMAVQILKPRVMFLST
ncbi:MAG: hypothetical protein IKK38_09585 [Spirochaetaceae bacterium]|nr:hypothetical protein [Spirochaetaceae bacterium]